MPRIQIWGGGPYHPTRAQGDWWKRVFGELGHQVDYSEERSIFSDENLGSTDLLVLSGMDESVVGPEAPLEYWETPPAGGKMIYKPLEEEYFKALMDYLGRGRPLLIHHSGLLSFDERKELDEIYDGRWIRGLTFHPPYQKFKVSLSNQNHPTLKNLKDFEIDDELYCKLLPPKRSKVLMTADWEGETRPLAWAGNYKGSKILFSGLGHDMGSYVCESLQIFLKNGVAWLLNSES